MEHMTRKLKTKTGTKEIKLKPIGFGTTDEPPADAKTVPAPKPEPPKT